jgi:hypothetical protein
MPWISQNQIFVRSNLVSFLLLFIHVQGSRFKVQGSKFKVQGSRFKVQGSRYQPNSRIESIWQRFEMELDGAMQEGQSYLLQYVIVTSFTLRKALTWLHQ